MLSGVKKAPSEDSSDAEISLSGPISLVEGGLWAPYQACRRNTVLVDGDILAGGCVGVMSLRRKVGTSAQEDPEKTDPARFARYKPVIQAFEFLGLLRDPGRRLVAEIVKSCLDPDLFVSYQTG